MNCSYAYRSDIWPALITLALIIYLGGYSWRRRSIPAAKPFILACVFGGFWTIGTIVEILASNYSGKVFWITFQSVWRLPAVTTITCFILQYAGLSRFLKPRTYLLLSIVPVLAGVVILTNESHNLMWSGFFNSAHVSASAGKLYWFFIGYGYLLSMINIVALVWLAVSSPGQRFPVAIILICQVVALIGYGIDKIYPDLIGPGERVLLIVGLMTAAYSLAFLRFHVIDPASSARKAVLRQMNSGMFVIDLQGRIVDVNPVASVILGIPENGMLGKPLAEIMPVDSGLMVRMENGWMGTMEIILGNNSSAGHYNLNLTQLKGKHNEVIGQLLLLHDVTELKRAQAQILEQQKVLATLKERQCLARELHDGIAQILGYLNMQAQTAGKQLHDGDKEKVESLLGRIAEVSKDAHADVRESILNLRTGFDPNLSLMAALKKHIDRFQADYGIKAEFSVSDRIGDNVFDPSTEVQLMRVIQEAMTNCRKHSGARFLKVDVTLDGSKAFVTVSDDGKGFDAGCLEREGCAHFGLVFMRERMEQIGGSFKIDSIPGSGTILKLAVPVREQMQASQ